MLIETYRDEVGACIYGEIISKRRRVCETRIFPHGSKAQNCYFHKFKINFARLALASVEKGLKS